MLNGPKTRSKTKDRIETVANDSFCLDLCLSDSFLASRRAQVKKFFFTLVPTTTKLHDVVRQNWGSSSDHAFCSNWFISIEINAAAISRQKRVTTFCLIQLWFEDHRDDDDLLHLAIILEIYWSKKQIFFKWAIDGLFSLFFCFYFKQLTVNCFWITVADD